MEAELEMTAKLARSLWLKARGRRPTRQEREAAELVAELERVLQSKQWTPPTSH